MIPRHERLQSQKKPRLMAGFFLEFTLKKNRRDDKIRN